MIPVRQARVLPPSFFRFHLAMDTLDLGYILPTAGRIRDFHPLERALTGRTSERQGAQKAPCRTLISNIFPNESIELTIRAFKQHLQQFLLQITFLEAVDIANDCVLHFLLPLFFLPT